MADKTTATHTQNAQINDTGDREALPVSTVDVPSTAVASEATPKACLSLLGGSLGLFISFGWVNCIALFQAEYEVNQLRGYSSSSVSWITSTELFLMLFISPVAGYLFDNYGPRLPIFVGGLLEVFGLMMASLSTEYYQFMLSQAIVAGIGASLVFNPSMTSPMTYFRKLRALAGGLAVAGSSIGGIVFPVMVNSLLSRIGFAWTMRSCAFMILGPWAVVLATISSNIPVKRREFRLSLYFQAFRDTNFLILCASAFFLYWGIMVPFNYLSVSAIARGMSLSMALNLVPIMNAGSFVGRTLPNLMADRYGRFNIMIVMMIFTAVITLALWIPSGHSNAAIIAFAALFGFGSGACIGLLPALVMNISSSDQGVGFWMGAALAIGGIASLTSPPIGGAIATGAQSYNNAFIFSASSILVSGAFMIMVRGRVVGWTFFKRDPKKT